MPHNCFHNLHTTYASKDQANRHGDSCNCKPFAEHKLSNLFSGSTDCPKFSILLHFPKHRHVINTVNRNDACKYSYKKESCQSHIYCRIFIRCCEHIGICNNIPLFNPVVLSKLLNHCFNLICYLPVHTGELHI